MPNARVLVLRAPGTNCDVETAFAFQQVGAEVNSIHMRALREFPGQLGTFPRNISPAIKQSSITFSEFTDRIQSFLGTSFAR